MKNILMKVSLFVFALSSFFQEVSMADVADRIVAVVGNEIILKSEIDGRELMTRMQYPQLANDKGLARSILEGVIDQKIILAKAKIDSVGVDENAINSAANDRFRSLSARFPSKGEMEARFGKSAAGIKEQIKQELRNQQLVETLRRKKSAGVLVSNSEVESFYKENRDQLPDLPLEVSVSQIVKYPEVSAEVKAEAMGKIRLLQEELKSGADFAELARKYSQDPGSAKLGGDLGYSRKGEFIPSFEAAAYALREGQVSDVVETRFGYHLIQLLNKESNSLRCRHILIIFDRSKTESQSALAQLSEIRKKVLDREVSFADMAKKYSDDIPTAAIGGAMIMGGNAAEYFPVTALRPELRDILAALKKTGDISSPQKIVPQQGETFFAIFRLNGVKPAHKLTLESDYAKIEQLALENKNRKRFSEWVDSLRKEVFVRILD
ncbi:MAG: peptidylprolyl isomerase [Chlorobiaceae bacterium]|nr:peptidylprolyl isomerase [Chlorobiaceae bacterium]NTV59919.1 peptidylprolyl isomerase [Chlorobiaceae bacterium]